MSKISKAINRMADVANNWDSMSEQERRDWVLAQPIVVWEIVSIWAVRENQVGKGEVVFPFEQTAEQAKTAYRKFFGLDESVELLVRERRG
jgi:hypothetical protein